MAPLVLFLPSGGPMNQRHKTGTKRSRYSKKEGRPATKQPCPSFRLLQDACKMERVKGLEPPNLQTTIWRSFHMSYTRSEPPLTAYSLVAGSRRLRGVQKCPSPHSKGVTFGAEGRIRQPSSSRKYMQTNNKRAKIQKCRGGLLWWLRRSFPIIVGNPQEPYTQAIIGSLPHISSPGPDARVSMCRG